MPGGLIDDLRARLRDERVVVIAGSGVTAAATGGHPLSSWSELIASGVEHASQLPGIEHGMLNAARSLLEVGNASSLLAAAELVTDALGGREGGEYARWLTETVGALELHDPSVADALVSLGVPLATTNYDDLIEQASGRERVTWIDGGVVQRALQGDDPAIVHVHGHWRAARSVILGVRSYEELAHDDTAQALQRAMATMNSLLFVGVGDGASDPNFGALRTWLTQSLPAAHYRHFRLCLEGEVEALSAEHSAEERIFPLAYGSDHSDLAGFLVELATTPRGSARTARPADGPVGLPARPVTLGRDEEVRQATAQLFADPPQPVLLNGAPGIGKTNLTLAVLHDPDVVGQFGSRRWFVRCEGLESAAGLQAEIARSIGLSPVGDVRSATIGLLSQAPTILVLDNLETPWERDALAVEELIGVIAQIPGLALLASVRGLERPSGVRWARPTQLEPLDPSSAQKLFLSIAPESFDAPALDGLLEEMGGIPLAIELLAHVADGETDLDHLTERWREERAKLLARGSADHRLLSIAVSVDTSWNSPAMTEPAKRLLALLGRLPDGIADEDLEALIPGEGPAAANLLRRRGLAEEEMSRLRTLPPIRHYVAEAHPVPDEDWQRAMDHFCSRSARLGRLAGDRGGAEAISRLSLESANITAVINGVLGGEGGFELGFSAANAFIEAARFGGLDAGPIVEALLTAAERSGRVEHLAVALRRAGDIASQRSDNERAREAYEQAQPLFEQVGNVHGRANCIFCLGDIALRCSDYAAAHEAYTQAQPLYEQVGNVTGQANCIQSLGDIALRRSDLDTAREAYERARPLYEQVSDVLGQANCIQCLGDIALRRSDLDTAREAYERARPLFEGLGTLQGQANCIFYLGDIAMRCSDFDGAHEAFGEARSLYEQVSDVLGQANCVQGLGNIALRRLEDGVARNAYEQALPLYEQVGDVLGQANCLHGLGHVAHLCSDNEAARETFEQALELCRAAEEPHSVGFVSVSLARLAEEGSERCSNVAQARAAWSSIKRDDLLALLSKEFPDCD
jgi:tetratricopeptide (TPR) repeat protein